MARKIFTAILSAFVLSKVEAIRPRGLENLIATVLRMRSLCLMMGMGRVLLMATSATVAKASLVRAGTQ